jgi:hypothetical protein
MRRIINLTLHPINLEINGKIIEIPNESFALRVSEEVKELGTILTEKGEVKRIRKKLTEIPEEQILELKKKIWNGNNQINIVIVSLLAGMKLKEDKRLSLAEKSAIYVIGETIRDEKGRVIGAKSLVNILDL